MEDIDQRTEDHAVQPSSGRRRHSRGSMSNEEPRSPFLPLAILAFAMLIWLGFQTTQLVIERNGLSKTRSNQSALVENSKKLRTALDTLAAGTKRMADEGNPSAKLIVEELRKRGVTINPAAAAAPAGK